MSTITDVAKRAGVSPVTVSRVINDAPNVNPATRSRVEQAIRELNYIPNSAARSLRSKRTFSIALLVTDITNAFWTTVARGVEDAAQSGGYTVLLCNTDESPAKQRRYLEVILSQRVDGVIVAPYSSDARDLSRLIDQKVPTVIIDRRVQGWEGDMVYCDSISGARALVQHLIRLGHRRIAMISGPYSASTSEDRIAGYCLAMHEAGIPVDPRLIKRGAYRADSGEQLAREIIREGLNPSAIFAANNAIATGVMKALDDQHLRVPQDIALVCFDESADVGRIFPFFTVVAQPAYDMGVNAAQLLLSRINAEVELRPRQVVLPTRLLLRYSCGRLLHDGNAPAFSLHLPDEGESTSVLVKPLSLEDTTRLEECIPEEIAVFLRRKESAVEKQKADVNRLLQALQHRQPDRLPYLELRVDSRAVYEYVLQREPNYEVLDERSGIPVITPEDHVEFARRLGMDAVPCLFLWRPDRSGALVHTTADLDGLPPPPPLTAQLGVLERYLRAAQSSGVGVFALFSSFYETALRCAGLHPAPRGEELPVFPLSLLEKLMELLATHQERVLRVVCDRFGDDLAFVMLMDEPALLPGDNAAARLFAPLMKRLTAPAREHGKLLAIHTHVGLEQSLPLLYEIGFSAAHPLGGAVEDSAALKQRWAGKMALMGGFPSALLAEGNAMEIEAQVKRCCDALAPGGGYVLGCTGGIPADALPANLMAMTRAALSYGHHPAGEAAGGGV